MLQDLIDRIFYDPEAGGKREVVGLRELAPRLDVCYKTLLRAVHAGQLPKFRRREPIDDPWGSDPEPIGTDADGNPIPF